MLYLLAHCSLQLQCMAAKEESKLHVVSKFFSSNWCFMPQTLMASCVYMWCVLLMVHKVDKLTVESQRFKSDYSQQYFAPLAKEVRRNLAYIFLTFLFLRCFPYGAWKVGIPLCSSLFWRLNFFNRIFYLSSLVIWCFTRSNSLTSQCSMIVNLKNQSNHFTFIELAKLVRHHTVTYSTSH